MEIETGAGETIYIYSSDKIPHSSFLERTNESIHSSTAFLDGTNQPTCTYACFERPFFNKAPLSLHVRLSLAPWDFFFLIPRGAPFSPSSSSVQLCIYTLERTSSFSFPPPHLPPTPPTRPDQNPIHMKSSSSNPSTLLLPLSPPAFINSSHPFSLPSFSALRSRASRSSSFRRLSASSRFFARCRATYASLSEGREDGG